MRSSDCRDLIVTRQEWSCRTPGKALVKPPDHHQVEGREVPIAIACAARSLTRELLVRHRPPKARLLALPPLEDRREPPLCFSCAATTLAFVSARTQSKRRSTVIGSITRQYCGGR